MPCIAQDNFSSASQGLQGKIPSIGHNCYDLEALDPLKLISLITHAVSGYYDPKEVDTGWVEYNGYPLDSHLFLKEKGYGIPSQV
jgi:hypothetical protein